MIKRISIQSSRFYDEHIYIYIYIHKENKRKFVIYDTHHFYRKKIPSIFIPDKIFFYFHHIKQPIKHIKSINHLLELLCLSP